MKVFCQSTTPASDSCRARTDGNGSVQKSRRELVHSEERICMTPAGPEADDGRGGSSFRNGVCRYTWFAVCDRRRAHSPEPGDNWTFMHMDQTRITVGLSYPGMLYLYAHPPSKPNGNQPPLPYPVVTPKQVVQPLNRRILEMRIPIRYPTTRSMTGTGRRPCFTGYEVLRIHCIRWRQRA